MTMKTLLGAAALALTTAAPLAAAPINLDFSFGGVSGTFYGLDNADGTSSATSYDFSGLLGNYTGIDTGDPNPNGFSNEFLFFGGVLISYEFLDFPFVSGTTGTTSLRKLSLSSFGGWEVFEGDSTPNGANTIGNETVLFKQQPLSAVPLPAGFVLLLSGLAGVAGLNRRKKHTA